MAIILALLLTSCNRDQLDGCLMHLHEINKQIGADGWQVAQKFKVDKVTTYSLKKEVADTSYRLSFSIIKEGAIMSYSLGDFIKSYKNDTVYVEMALLNQDTLYLFTRKNTEMAENPSGVIDLSKIEFLLGKYYYLYSHGKLSWNQQMYFEAYRDSLINVRGNRLPVLNEK